MLHTDVAGGTDGRREAAGAGPLGPSPAEKHIRQATRRALMTWAGENVPSAPCVHHAAHRDDCKVSLARHIRREIVAGAFARAAPRFLGDRGVGVYAHTGYEGLGDIAAMAKIGARLLAAGARVELVLPLACAQRRAWRDFFSFLPPASVFALDDVDVARRLGALDVVLVWRGQNVGPRYGAFFRPEGRDEGVKRPALNILEYDTHAERLGPDMVETGFSRLAIGHAVDDDLAHFAQLPKAAREAARERCYRDWRRAADVIDPREPQWWPAARPAAIHTLYTHQPVAACLPASLWFHGSSPADLRLVVVGDVEGACADACPEASLRLPDGFARLEISLPGGRRRSLSRHDGGAAPEGRTLFVWGVPPLAHASFVAMLKVSDFVAVTGDQSLSEAISAGVPFAYAPPAHKVQLARNLARLGDLSGPGREVLAWLLGLTGGAAPKATHACHREELARWSASLRLSLDWTGALWARVMRRIGGHAFDDCRRHFPVIERCLEKTPLDRDPLPVSRALALALRRLEDDINEA